CQFFFFQAEDGIRDYKVTGVQTCALPISKFDPRHVTVPRIVDEERALGPDRLQLVALDHRRTAIERRDHVAREAHRRGEHPVGRSEERRVGKEWRSRGAPDYEKEKRRTDR